MKKYSLLIVSLLTVSLASAQSLLWKVSGNELKQPSYLFGTYHILKDSYLDGTPKVKKAYQQAQGVVVETTVDSSAMLQMAMQAMMFDNSLRKLISPEDYELVAKEFRASTGIDLAMFDQIKPVYTAMMLSMAQIEKESDTLRKFTGLPLDLFFASDGQKQGKTITPLETMEEQMGFLLNHDSIDKQAEQLVQIVKDKREMQHSSKRITDLYLKEDLAGMWKMNEEYSQKYGDTAYLVDKRNENWLKRLPALMASKPLFVAVGALHLPGPNGLIELLRKAGYTVEPQLN